MVDLSRRKRPGPGATLSTGTGRQTYAHGLRDQFDPLMRKATAILLVVLFSSPVFAHRPYAVKQGIIEGPGGNAIIKEHVYGDGIFVADPGAFQLRSRNGMVLASSPVGQHVGTFCPSVSFCWAFPYGQVMPFSSGWKLDPESIKIGQSPPRHEFSTGEEKEFRAYLEVLSVSRVHGNFLGDPRFRTSHSGFVRVPWSAALSPFVIIADNFWKLVSAFVSTAFLFILYRLSFMWAQARVKALRPVAYLLGSFVFLGCVLVYSVGLFFAAFTASTPYLYLLLAVGGGARVGYFASNKLLARVNASTSS